MLGLSVGIGRVPGYGQSSTRIGQGKGFGAVLMQHALTPCDRDRTLAYLESSNPKNVPLYERYGFESLGTI